MAESFMRVGEVAKMLEISESYAYKIMRQLNRELKEKGMITIAGRVSRQYFLERLCYGVQGSETTEGK